MIAKTPWLQRKFNFDFPVSHFPFIVERLRGAAPQIADLVQNHSEAELSQRPVGKWSIKEHIGHLTDLDELHEKRLFEYLQNKTQLSPADMSNQKTNEAHHNDKTSSVLVDELRQKRAGFIKKLEPLTEEQISRTALHPRLQLQMRLVDMLYFVAEHDIHHITSMREILESSKN